MFVDLVGALWEKAHFYACKLKHISSQAPSHDSHSHHCPLLVFSIYLFWPFSRQFGAGLGVPIREVPAFRASLVFIDR